MLPLLVSHGSQLSRVNLKKNQIRKIILQAWVYSYINILEEAREVKEKMVPNLSKSRVIYWRRQWHPTPVLLPRKSHGRRSLVGSSSWGRLESDTTERLHFHFSLSCIGERSGTPLQCSCLENPRDRGAWWAAIYGVAQSWTRLK